MANSCSNSDVVEFGLVYLLDVSLGSSRAGAQRVDFSFLVGFGSVDVVAKTGPRLALTVCLSEVPLLFVRCCRCTVSSHGYDEDFKTPCVTPPVSDM